MLFACKYIYVFVSKNHQNNSVRAVLVLAEKEVKGKSKS